MPRTRESAAYARRLIKEYNHARKLLYKYLKKRHEPSDVTAMIVEVIENMTARQSKIIGYTLNKSFKAGTKEGDKIISKARVTASTATLGFDMSKVADTHLNKITATNIGHIGKYNGTLKGQLLLEHKALLADNKLVSKLAQTGWTPSIEKSLLKRGTSAEVIALVKGQTTSTKMIRALEMQGIRGGMNPRQVSRLLQPAVSNYFGPKGVLIDNVGKFKKVLKVDVDGNYKYMKQAITRPYRATPKSYSNLLARSSMISAHHEGRYQSLQKTGLVDHYISKSILDANTCSLCATMHGQKISHSEGPLYHPSCACELKPIWKKDSGIPNKDPGFYDKQRDQHFWKQHQLAEYNKGLPKGAKLKFHSMLPKDVISAMPSTSAMRTIRYNALGKPGAIKPSIPITKPKVTPKPTPSKAVPKPTSVKPSLPKPTKTPSATPKETGKLRIAKEKTVKPKAGKKSQLEKMKKEEREKANELWKKTDKDGFEHAKVTNSRTSYASGNGDSVYIRAPSTSFKSIHTHPGWDAPLSGADVTTILKETNCNRLSAASSKRIFVMSRTKDTKYAPESFKVLNAKFTNKSKEIYKKAISVHKKKTGKLPTKSEASQIWGDSILEMNKAVAKEYKLDYTAFSRT